MSSTRYTRASGSVSSRDGPSARSARVRVAVAERARVLDDPVHRVLHGLLREQVTRHPRESRGEVVRLALLSHVRVLPVAVSDTTLIDAQPTQRPSTVEMRQTCPAPRRTGSIRPRASPARRSSISPPRTG